MAAVCCRLRQQQWESRNMGPLRDSRLGSSMRRRYSRGPLAELGACSSYVEDP
ncbi:unnamed protein product [Staurois parvus]|uniref:Uncharacterized protein n=1 Tax=Staurois parvus TaxID=386267 RepID=A0ABN9EG76_9NEOB|nr:unnamed protein product [Staurois parvus]